MIGNNENMELASIESRFISYIIDKLVLAVIGFILGVTFGLLFGSSISSQDFETWLAIISISVAVWYYTYHFGEGQTPGMKVMKIKLCRTDGMYRIGYWKGFIRGFAMNISGIVLFLGYFWILIDKNNQGWHDIMADTYVVREATATDILMWGYMEKGHSETNSGNFGKAIEYFDKVLAINPQNELVWAKKGMLYSSLGRHEEAIECYNRALEINPQNSDVLGKKSCSLLVLGRKDG